MLVGPSGDPAARSYHGQIGRFLADVPREDLRQAAVLVRDVRDAGPLRILMTLRTSVHNALERDLARAALPTLLLRGHRDPVAPAGWLARAARICPGPVEVDAVPGAHNTVTTSGQEVADRVMRFLSTNRAGR